MGGVDLEEYVTENLHEVEDWELNFKMLKSAARDAEKLPNEVKVGVRVQNGRGQEDEKEGGGA